MTKERKKANGPPVSDRDREPESVPDRELAPPSDREQEPGPAPAASVDQAIVDTFESEVAAARRQADENWDRFLRAEAELDNMRKRAERRREEALALQRRELLARFLEVMDNLERALAQGESEPAVVLAGVEATYRDLGRFLTREGVEAIHAMDEPFDPALHEAVGVVPLPATAQERVVAVDRPGYTLGGELLRPARVLVGQPATAEADEHAADE